VRRLPLEVAVVWTLFALVTVEVFVTYSRLPARELYHVSGTGLEGGASRALVFANFPTALVALAVLLVLAEHANPLLVALAAVLCAPVFWPGVVSQANLDAKPVNAVAALGVFLTLALSVARIARTSWRRSDAARVAIAAPLVLVALPWFAADLGFFLNGVPLLGRIFRTGTHRHRIAGLPPFPPAVHHGHHHGMDGLLLVLSALLLSRLCPAVRNRGLRAVLTAYLALMLCYGIGNIANDFWLEQVVKRDWTSWEIPNVLEPRATVAWATIVVAAALLAGLAWRYAGGGNRTHTPLRESDTGVRRSRRT
jgi:hypothetical protein